MYLPSHIHSTYSFLDGFAKVDKLVDKLQKYDIGCCAITDHRNMSGCVEFSESLIKKTIKPILGIEFDISLGPASDKSEINKRTYHMVALAKNKKGYQTLCKLTSLSNQDEYFYYRPRLDLQLLEEYWTEDLIAFTGHKGSLLHQVLSSVSPAEQLLVGEKYLYRLKTITKGNLYLEIQKVCDHDPDYHSLIRSLSERTEIPAVASIDAHYIDRVDARNQRLLLASSLKTTLKKYRVKLEGSGLLSFFENDYYHLPTPAEMAELHPEKDLKLSQEIADQCEVYSLKGQPILPKFADNEKEMLRQICEDGWNTILKPRNLDKQEYRDRLNSELATIEEYGLSGYFLIVKDFIQYARNSGGLAIPRGSASGSLVSYLCGLTYVDPLPNQLLFSRFLNKGRFTKDNFEYPDIDVDFNPEIREKVFDYIKDKYGKENVGQIATFSTLKGAGALKEVLRMHEACTYTEMNEITKNIPKDASIAGEMEEQNEDSILMFTLKNMPSTVEQYCQLKDGELVGEYSEYFKQAIEIEGAIKSQGIHAAGLIIAPTPLSEICPLGRGSEGEQVCAYEKNSLKKIGLVKFDILGVNVLSKLLYYKKLMENSNV